MAANGDPANHSSASNKSVKKMKKRKELDALLTGANGKAKHFNKPSNKPPKKDGHELLIPDESDSVDSSENDFFATPKKTIIRKPRQWRICATCIPLCIFVLTLACIVVTTGLIWMHMDLKEDLDDLRERLAKVEADVQTSQTQAATVSSLESKLEKLQGSIIKNQHALNQMAKLNESINDLKTQVKTLKSSQANTAASNELQLQQDVANMGLKVNELEEMKGSVKELQDKVNEVTGNVGTLDGTVSKLTEEYNALLARTQKTDSNGVEERPVPGLQPGMDAVRGSSPNPGISEVSHDVELGELRPREVIPRLIHSLDEMNDTITTIRHYQQGLDARLTLLEAMGVSETPHKDNTVAITPQMMTVFTKIHNDVNTLMNWYNETQLHSPTDVTKPTVSSPIVHESPDGAAFISSEAHYHWELYVNTTLWDIQNRIESLSLNNTDSDPLSSNATGILEQSFEDFKDTYRREVTDMQNDQRSAREDIDTLTNNLKTVQKRFTWVYERLEQLQVAISNITEHAKVTLEPSGAIAPPSHTPAAEHKQTSATIPPHNSPLSQPQPTQSSAITPTSKSSNLSMHDSVKSTSGHSTEPTLQDEVTAPVDEYTTGDGLIGPEWQKPLDILQPKRLQTVEFPGVNNIEDLANKFSLWDKNGDGFVIYDDLPDFLGPFTPKADVLFKFDKDKDGRFDLEEMIAAAGLS